MNQNTTTYPFSEPIGGIPLEYDFVPNLLLCIGFAVAYGINVHNLRYPEKITGTKFASFYISLERIVIMVLRMVACFRVEFRDQWFSIEYQQIALSCGFITLIQEQLYMILNALALATRDDMRYEEWQQLSHKSPCIKEKRKLERYRYREWWFRVDMAIRVIQWIQMLISWKWTDGQDNYADVVNSIRLVANLLSLFATCGILSMLFRFKDVENINQKAIRRFKLSITVLLIIPLFRSTVSLRTARSLSSSPPSALPAKIAFYIFQLLPELIACLISACTDYRSLCDTGMWGDIPRGRVERGQPAKPKCFVIFGIIFRPWLWPRAIRCWIVCQRDRIQSAPAGLFFDDDREKLLPSASSFGWKSTTDISSSIYSSQVDEEKQSIRSEPSSTYSRGWSTFGGSVSSTSTVKVGGDSSATVNTLIADVKLWRPHLPQAFSYE